MERRRGAQGTDRALTRRCALGLILLLLAMAAAPVGAGRLRRRAGVRQGTKAIRAVLRRGSQNNVENHGKLSGISFVTSIPDSRISSSSRSAPASCAALRDRLEGWFQYYLSPEEATAGRAEAGLPLSLLGLSLGAWCLTSRGRRGPAGTNLKVLEIDSPSPSSSKRVSRLLLHQPGLAVNVGYRFQHVSNTLRLVPRPPPSPRGKAPSARARVPGGDSGKASFSPSAVASSERDSTGTTPRGRSRRRRARRRGRTARRRNTRIGD